MYKVWLRQFASVYKVYILTYLTLVANIIVQRASYMGEARLDTCLQTTYLHTYVVPARPASGRSPRPLTTTADHTRQHLTVIVTDSAHLHKIIKINMIINIG